MSAGRRWRHRRNVVIVAALDAGLPPSWLAEVLDLSETRINEIRDQYRRAYQSDEST